MRRHCGGQAEIATSHVPRFPDSHLYQRVPGRVVPSFPFLEKRIFPLGKTPNFKNQKTLVARQIFQIILRPWIGSSWFR
jgi:hypothetical protein